MYFLFAIPAIAIVVMLIAEFHGLTKAFRPRETAASDVVAATPLEIVVESNL